MQNDVRGQGQGFVLWRDRRNKRARERRSLQESSGNSGLWGRDNRETFRQERADIEGSQDLGSLGRAKTWCAGSPEGGLSCHG
jgi:hypothetical protein